MQLVTPDGHRLDVHAPGEPLGKVLSDEDPDLKGQVVGGKFNGTVVDLTYRLPEDEDQELQLLTLEDDDAKWLYRHSMAHVLAQAVKRLYPEAKLAIGPPIEEGFYYDFDVEEPFTPDDLERIAEEMQTIIKEKHQFRRFELPRDEARKKLEELDEPYKLEILDDLEDDDTVSFYQDGEFVDLCRGPHAKHTGQVKHFKILDNAGAYWRGDEENVMLQRIYGTAFYKQEDLEAFLKRREEAAKRDHRRLGRELDLFSTKSESVGGGLVLWHPKGALVRHLIEDYCKTVHLEGGYDFVYTPHIGRSDLWEKSGHLDFYGDNMYAPVDIEGQQYYLKPMNCPFHIEIFRSQTRSYRDLPLRFAEWGTVYRFERSGVLHGLTRVRGFTQDDAHLFCRPDQMPAEIDRVINFSIDLLKDFGFKQFQLYLSTRPEERVGQESDWDDSEKALEDALQRSGMPYEVFEGDGAFYGPKIDIYVKDALDRPWQLSTIQFDFNLPERFDIHYVGEDGREHRPYMVHRALLGSIERFFGVYLEHCAGAFPVWLAPVQVSVLPIAERHVDYANQVLERLEAEGLRAEMNYSDHKTLSYRVRDAQMKKIPYMLVVGDREVENEEVSLRLRTEEDLGAQSLDEVIDFVHGKVQSKADL
ncbi:MAG: threonine--tRNA ligase [Candidatus Bipolaricaulia bacterium]